MADNQLCTCGHNAVAHHGTDRGDSGGCFGDDRGLLDPNRCTCRLTCTDVREGRAQPIVDTHGDWTLTITDDQPIPDGKTLAPDVRVTLVRAGNAESEFTYPAYRKYTLLAHWKDGLNADRGGDEG